MDGWSVLNVSLVSSVCVCVDLSITFAISCLYNATTQLVVALLCHLLLSLLLAAGQGGTIIALGMQLSKCSVLGNFFLASVISGV